MTEILGTLSNDDGDAKDDAWKKMNLYFTVEFRRCLDLFITSIGLRTCSSLICNASVQFQMRIRKISRRRSNSPKYPELGHFTLSFCRGRLRNVPAQLLLCSLNLLFGGVLVAVAVVVSLRSLLAERRCQATSKQPSRVPPP